MTYYLQAEKITLDDLQKRIEETDLVPSRSSLTENINKKFEILKSNGISTFADLRKELKNSKKIPAFAEKIGIDAEYLTVLRREIESYFPKAFPLKDFDWLPNNKISKLVDKGYKNAALFFDALNSPEKKEEIISLLEPDNHLFDALRALTNLTRIQWTSPLVAKMLLETGYTDTKMVAKADPEVLCEQLDKVNRENNYFKGKIGLRDINRLVKAASYVYDYNN